MKNAMKKFGLMWLLVCAVALIFVSCKKEDDDDNSGNGGGSGNGSVALPANVGTNEFAGKTWKVSNVSWNHGIQTLVFTDSTLKKNDENPNGYTEVYNYNYAYDSTNKLLYLSLVSVKMGDGTTITTQAEYVSFHKNEASEYKETWNERDEIEAKSGAKDLFEILRIYKYSISSDGSLKLAEYFSGSLPSNIRFESSSIKRIKGSDIRLECSDNSHTYIFMTYNNGSFSGTAVTEGTVLGKAAGTYTIQGTGTSNCTVTLRFTTLPDKITEISSVQKNTDYTLVQEENSITYASGENGSENVSAKLPANVGTNEFANKTWSASMIKYSFSDSTVKKIEEDEGDNEESNYKYSYDSTNKLLYLALVSIKMDDGTTITTQTGYVNFLKEAYDTTWNEQDVIKAKSVAKDVFEILEVYRYSIAEDDGSLSLEKYFAGSLPTAVEFNYSGTGGVTMQLEDSELKLRFSDNNKVWIYLTFNNDSFSGTVFKNENDLGTATGTYTAQGTGTSNCTVKLRFTSVPSELSTEIHTNTDYTLTQKQCSDTYTLSN